MYYVFYFTTTANARSVFFMKSEAHALVFYYVFSDCVSFGPLEKSVKKYFMRYIKLTCVHVTLNRRSI